MGKTNFKNLVSDYIEAWSTTDSEQRKQLINKVYSNTANFYANEPGDDAVQQYGLEKIFENITQVNERLVVDKKLNTEFTGYSENHNTLRVSWQMKTLDGNVVMKGMNFLLIDEYGKIARDYIFIN